VGGWCKSAGTLCVISANDIVMGYEAELGPLDVQLVKRDELGERDSGLVIEAALECLERYAFQFFDAFMNQIKDQTHGTVTLKLASDISGNVTKGLFEPIYRQIDPAKIGEIARSMDVGHACAQRLNLRGRNLKPGALKNLLQAYPSHGFVIDRQEAQVLFKRVSAPSTQQTSLLDALGDMALVPMPSGSNHVRLYEYQENSNENAAAKTESKSTERKAAGSSGSGAAAAAAGRIRKSGRATKK
jgi:hypothetical protein